MTANKASEQSLPYLAIKNWEKFQTPPKKDGQPLPWLRDYADQIADMDYCRLTVYQRGILQECRRLVQRRLTNIPNDAQFIGRAASLMPQDRINLRSTIAHLIAKGFLVPTESTNPHLRGEERERKREETRGESGEKSASSSGHETWPVTKSVPSPVVPSDSDRAPAQDTRPKLVTPEDVIAGLRAKRKIQAEEIRRRNAQ
jgi:hypothetical protein